MNALINALLNNTWGKLNGLWRTIVVIGLLLLVCLLVWYYGARAKNSLGNWFYQWHLAGAQSALKQKDQEIQASKQELQDLISRYKLVHDEYEAAKAETAAKEAIWADTTKTAAEKVRLYEALLRKTPTVTPVADDDFDAVCERAKSQGIVIDCH